MKTLLAKIQANYPDISFTEGQAFSWSPGKKMITYKDTAEEIAAWSLLHELAHALLDHRSYETDFELLLLEVAAWEKARELANNYQVEIDEDHIQDCIDTYRDWLYQRSNCPRCSNTSLRNTCIRCITAPPKPSRRRHHAWEPHAHTTTCTYNEQRLPSCHCKHSPNMSQQWCLRQA